MNRRNFLALLAAVVAVPKKMLIPVRAWWVQDETPAEGVARITDWGEEPPKLYVGKRWDMRAKDIIKAKS